MIAKFPPSISQPPSPFPSKLLKLVGIGKVCEHSKRTGSENSEPRYCNNPVLDLLAAALALDLHLGFDRPDVRLAVLVDGDAALDFIITHVQGSGGGREGGGLADERGGG